MTDAEEETYTPDPPKPDALGGTSHLTGRARSLANLRAPWTPEEARLANPSGLTKRGTPASTAKIDKELERQLAKRRATQRLVETWVKDAIEGEDGSTRAKARDQILARLYPVPKDEVAGRVVLEGLTIALTPGAEGPRAASFVERCDPESRVGGTLPQISPPEAPIGTPHLGYRHNQEVESGVCGSELTTPTVPVVGVVSVPVGGVSGIAESVTPKPTDEAARRGGGS